MIWRHNKKFKNHQRFFSYFCSFQLYHFQPNSIWCDSPFNAEFIRIFHFCDSPFNAEFIRIFHFYDECGKQITKHNINLTVHVLNIYSLCFLLIGPHSYWLAHTILVKISNIHHDSQSWAPAI
jgi:hypothetical protein